MREWGSEAQVDRERVQRGTVPGRVCVCVCVCVRVRVRVGVRVRVFLCVRVCV